jgi:hypothetical protein
MAGVTSPSPAPPPPTPSASKMYSNFASSTNGQQQANNIAMQLQYHDNSTHSNQPNYLNKNYPIPSLRTKTNELFYKWFSEPDRHEQLKEVISFIKTTNRMPKLNELQTFRNVCLV